MATKLYTWNAKVVNNHAFLRGRGTMEVELFVRGEYLTFEAAHGSRFASTDADIQRCLESVSIDGPPPSEKLFIVTENPGPIPGGFDNLDRLVASLAGASRGV